MLMLSIFTLFLKGEKLSGVEGDREVGKRKSKALLVSEASEKIEKRHLVILPLYICETRSWIESKPRSSISRSARECSEQAATVPTDRAYTPTFPRTPILFCK